MLGLGTVPGDDRTGDPYDLAEQTKQLGIAVTNAGAVQDSSDNGMGLELSSGAASAVMGCGLMS